MRRLISLVSPEHDLPPIAQLDHLVLMLFPELCDLPELERPAAPPKAYTISGVHFIPLAGNYPLRWLVTRAPHPSNMPRPWVAFSQPSLRYRADKPPKQWPFSPNTPFRLFDGRYWVQARTRLPCSVRFAPFEPEHLKPFREALDDRSRAALSVLLRRYAPAKIRWTLPAIYASMDVTEVMKGGDYWPADIGPALEEAISSETGEVVEDPELQTKSKHLLQLHWENIMTQRGKPQLLALPTLGIQLPGLENWLVWDVRYRKVDRSLLNGVNGRISRRRPTRAAAKKDAAGCRARQGGAGCAAGRGGRAWRRVSGLLNHERRRRRQGGR